MADFKFVQWGKGVPNDYQRLNAMMLNDQYLKDKIDPNPRGVLLWKEVPGQTFTPNGAYQSVTNLQNLSFDVEEGRLVTVEFQSGLILTTTYATVLCGVTIDSAVYSGVGGTGVVPFISGALTYDGFASFSATLVVPSALSSGNHTVTVQIASGANVASLQMGASSTGMTLIVRDEGAFRSAST